jgi:surface protein
MIEIFPEEDKINHFLEMEPLENIEKARLNKNADIYFLQTDKYGKNFVAFGIMDNLNNINSNSDFKGKKSSLGSPILLLESFKVIASVADLKEIKATNSDNEINQNLDIKSEISLKVFVDETNIGKDVYIINGPYYIINEDNILKGSDLKEINENNIIMYINGVETKFEKKKKFRKEGIYSIDLKFKINLTDISRLFLGCIYVTEIKFKNFNTENITDMNCMFFGCMRLKDLDISSFDTKNVKKIFGFFGCCYNLVKIDLSNFNTQNVYDMGSMFYKCLYLSSVDLSNFNTENAENMNGMFNECLSLTEINLSSFNTKNVENMSLMFYKCQNLINLDLSNFDKKNVNDFMSMFTG